MLRVINEGQCRFDTAMNSAYSQKSLTGQHQG